MSIRVEGAIIGVGHIILQRIPKGPSKEPGSVIVQPAQALVVPESALEDNYEAALQEFKDDVKANLKHDFEPPQGFKDAVLNHLRWYLEGKGMLA